MFRIKIDAHLLIGKLLESPRVLTDLINGVKDYLIGDKGYSFARVNRLWNLITPRRAGRYDNYFGNILNSANASWTREVTAIRNVVEHVIGI